MRGTSKLLRPVLVLVVVAVHDWRHYCRSSD
jgi:hypothetical protein